MKVNDMFLCDLELAAGLLVQLVSVNTDIEVCGCFKRDHGRQLVSTYVKYAPKRKIEK